MSFTGIRGFFAPFFGYWIEAKVGFDGVSDNFSINDFFVSRTFSDLHDG